MSYQRPKPRLVSGMYGNGGANGVRRRNTGDLPKRGRSRPVMAVSRQVAWPTGTMDKTSQRVRFTLLPRKQDPSTHSERR